MIIMMMLMLVQKRVFIFAVYRLDYIFRGLSSYIKVKLLQTYCTVWVSDLAASHYCCRLHGNPVDNIYSKDHWTATRTRTILLPELAGSLSFSHLHQRRVSRLLDTMMSSTNPALQYIACRSTTSTIGAHGKNGHIRTFMVTWSSS